VVYYQHFTYYSTWLLALLNSIKSHSVLLLCIVCYTNRTDVVVKF